ncbi:MAG: 3'(2'),5'-bisphosphate nucleotidase CysQ [Mesorhizobium sp.]|nr:3'(2'),5'-bisphosphate nucleotidase CysQ [Mesorhizobium sp.]MBL8579432.1 3'(2'),5'-bisphosphate nucleotidase CysQ [Mesorhizobium sp.]
MPAVDDAINAGVAADLAADLALLKEATREAGKIAMRYFRQNPEVWLKGGSSPVSEADYAADKFLRETLLAARPDYGWLSEETADDAARLKARRTFIIDPIDGTRGFLDGRREWCVSAAVTEGGRPLVGVLECPAKNETYLAKANGGAFRDGKPLRIGAPRSPPVVGGPVSMINAMPPALRDRVKRAEYIPSLAYRIAMVADGRLDATFIKPNSQDWDLAAADLILHEAGGAILDDGGVSPTYGGRETVHGLLVAGSGELLAAMGRTIRGEA